jgi:hypothetical protein
VAAATIYAVLLADSLDARGLAAYARIGSRFINGAESSPAIERFAGDAIAPFGYDGQFFLYIAADPTHAVDYLDTPGYRYGRILYPMVARVVALGDLRLLPAALLAVNLLAVLAATYVLAVYLERRGASAWWALVFAMYPGMWVGVYFDLSEPLAYALAAVAMTQLTRRPAVAAALLAAGILTRETVALFAIAAVVALARENRRRALWFGVVAMAPLIVWRLTLRAWLGNWGNAPATQFEHVPFGGAVGQQGFLIFVIAVPAIVALAIVAARRAVTVEALALLLNVLVLVVFLPRASWGGYVATGRISTGVVLAFLLCVPRLGVRKLALLPVTIWILGWLLAPTGTPQ